MRFISCPACGQPQRAGDASDIHALAALACEMLSGARLFPPSEAPGPLHLLISSGNQNLPPLQPHCLENTGAEPLRVLGVFHPAGSPAAKQVS